MDLATLRRKYGTVFVTAISENEIIPWKQLTVGEYLEYSTILESKQYARATIEDEIFQKCVVDDILVSRMDKFHAGTISSVVNDILKISGPESIAELNVALAVSRLKANQAIHETVALIAQAFPAYKLEDLYNLDYASFLLRLAQAESKLLMMGILEEPIFFEEPQVETEEEAEEIEEDISRPDPVEVARALRAKKQTRTGKTVISSSEMVSQESVMMGHEKEDQVLLRQQMLEEAENIYGDYFEQTKKGEKINIESPEKRLEAADQRATLNKAAFDDAVLQKRKEEQTLLENITRAKRRKAAKNK
tara:strand:+ start:962 stop:1879 length:918 start_codon:yes stop_codon:yes gene_type:complete